MKKINPKFYIALGAFAFALFLTRPAHAFTLVSQEVKTATSTARNMVSSDVKHFYQSLGTGLSGTVTGVQFENKVDAISGSASVSIWSCNASAQPVGCTGFANDESKTYTITSTSTTAYDVTFDDPVVLSSSRYYYLGFSNGGAEVGYVFSGSASDLYANGSCSWMDYPSASIACGGISDMYFILESVEGISFLFPSDSVSYAGDFNSFWVNYGVSAAGETDFIVYYATSSANLNSSATRWSDENGLSIGGQVDNGQIAVPKSNALALGGTYYARANLEQANVNVATSSIITFSIAGTGFIDSFNRFLPTSAPTSTSTALTITCDPDDGFFQNSFCKLFQYLFVPPPDAMKPFTDLKTELSSKPPFGYIAVITNALSSSSLANGTSSSSLGAITSLSVFSTLRTGIGYLMYMMFAFYIFNRFKKMNI